MRPFFVPGLLALSALLAACDDGSSTVAVLILDQRATEAADCEVQGSAPEGPLRHYLGTMHEHSSYSDGDIHARPADYYAQIRVAGLDYAGGSEHSDTLDTGMFISVGSDCFSTPDGLLTCLSPNGPDDLIKWQATAEQAQAASDADFLGIRGFEWTSDRFGHINVYFSSQFSNAKTDLGYVLTLEAFWDWFSRPPEQPGLLGGSPTSPVPFGGGADGLAHFNHPGDKCLSESDAACDWYDLQLEPSAAERMFGMEIFNGSAKDERYLPRFLHALRQGWWLSPVGSEDEHGTDWGSPDMAKTVTLASRLDEAGFREAWLARRTYALRGGYGDLRIHLSAAGQPMGSQLECAPGGSVPFVAEVQAGAAPVAGLRLYNGAGEIVAQSAENALQLELPVQAAPDWYLLQVLTPEGQGAAYAAPVRISPR